MIIDGLSSTLPRTQIQKEPKFRGTHRSPADSHGLLLSELDSGADGGTAGTC